MNGAHQFGRVVELPPIPSLAKPDSDWCEEKNHEVKEGAHSRDERDEEDTLEYDCWHRPSIRDYETACAEFHAAEVPADGLNPRAARGMKVGAAHGRRAMRKPPCGPRPVAHLTAGEHLAAYPIVR